LKSRRRQRSIPRQDLFDDGPMKKNCGEGDLFLSVAIESRRRTYVRDRSPRLHEGIHPTALDT
jgi:hypothetical protein